MFVDYNKQMPYYTFPISELLAFSYPFLNSILMILKNSKINEATRRLFKLRSSNHVVTNSSYI